MTFNNSSFKSNDRNVPLHSEKNVPGKELVDSVRQRKYVKREQARELGELNYSKNGMGITIQDMTSWIQFS